MNFLKISVTCKYLGSGVTLRLFNTSSAVYLNQKLRLEKGLSMNPNTRGVLTDSPDFTFLDGRATPYGSRQRARMQKQRELTEKIMELSSEVDFAFQRHKQMKLEKERTTKEILENKLKPKGVLLLKSNK